MLLSYIKPALGPILWGGALVAGRVDVVTEFAAATLATVFILGLYLVNRPERGSVAEAAVEDAPPGV